METTSQIRRIRHQLRARPRKSRRELIGDGGVDTANSRGTKDTGAGSRDEDDGSLAGKFASGLSRVSIVKFT
jgi:hypothetical protein